MSLSHNIKTRLRLFIEASVTDALVKHGFPLQGHQQRWKSVDEAVRFESAKVLSAINSGKTFDRPYEAAFKAFSQFNEDGILDYIIRETDCRAKTFVEIGVEDYRESNTRFLVEHRYWSGVTIDAGNDAATWMRSSNLELYHDVRHIQSFVTKHNVDSLVSSAFPELDVLSIDVDGVDYYLWEALSAARPKIVVIEFNPNFGNRSQLVVPYKDDFTKRNHHFSQTCFGASLPALVHLGRSKGYSLVETSDGPNAFFVRDDCLGSLRERSADECWRNWNVKEAMNPDGSNAWISNRKLRQENMADGVVIDLVSGQQTTVGAVLLKG